MTNHVTRNESTPEGRRVWRNAERAAIHAPPWAVRQMLHERGGKTGTCARCNTEHDLGELGELWGVLMCSDCADECGHPDRCPSHPERYANAAWHGEEMCEFCWRERLVKDP